MQIYFDPLLYLNKQLRRALAEVVQINWMFGKCSICNSLIGPIIFVSFLYSLLFGLCFRAGKKTTITNCLACLGLLHYTGAGSLFLFGQKKKNMTSSGLSPDYLADTIPIF